MGIWWSKTKSLGVTKEDPVHQHQISRHFGQQLSRYLALDQSVEMVEVEVPNSNYSHKVNQAEVHVYSQWSCDVPLCAGCSAP